MCLLVCWNAVSQPILSSEREATRSCSSPSFLDFVYQQFHQSFHAHSAHQSFLLPEAQKGLFPACLLKYPDSMNITLRCFLVASQVQFKRICTWQNLRGRKRIGSICTCMYESNSKRRRWQGRPKPRWRTKAQSSSPSLPFGPALTELLAPIILIKYPTHDFGYTYYQHANFTSEFLWYKYSISLLCCIIHPN